MTLAFTAWMGPSHIKACIEDASPLVTAWTGPGHTIACIWDAYRSRSQLSDQLMVE